MGCSRGGNLTDHLQLTHAPVSKAEMLIRKPIAHVFNAFIDPNVTTHVSFTQSTGKLEPGKQITWTWEMCGAGAQVTVKEIEKDRRILIEWPSHSLRNTVEWLFTPYSSDATYMSITKSGFKGDGDQGVRAARHGCNSLRRDCSPDGTDSNRRKAAREPRATPDARGGHGSRCRSLPPRRSQALPGLQGVHILVHASAGCGMDLELLLGKCRAYVKS
jgi:uncharacterized protein YndB with AHSA1/START domain